MCQHLRSHRTIQHYIYHLSANQNRRQNLQYCTQNLFQIEIKALKHHIRELPIRCLQSQELHEDVQHEDRLKHNKSWKNKQHEISKEANCSELIGFFFQHSDSEIGGTELMQQEKK